MTETAVTPPASDERLVHVGRLARLLMRPDIGAALGAIAVFLAFGYFARDVNWIGDPAIAAGWTDQAAQYGIVAVPVALLMIGGEFDLSAGVMIGSSGLLLGYLATHAHMNIWPAILIVLLFGVAVGFVNGLTVVRTRLPSFIVTLATFFVLQRSEEHTSELQSQSNLVCRLLLEKKKISVRCSLHFSAPTPP